MFSPVDVRSAIGRVSLMVTGELVRAGHEVVVATSDLRRPSEAHPFDGPAISWRDAPAIVREALAADAIVYQIGDNFQFHAGCVEWMPRARGLVCLHDYFVGNLFLGAADARHLDVWTEVARVYGTDAADEYVRAAGSTTFIDDTAERAPMTEWACEQALAVVTHSTWAIGRVERSCAGPIRVVPLPYEAPQVAKRSRRDDGTLRILTVGHVNKNKRSDSVIRAIARSERLRRTAVYSIVGAADPAVSSRLADLAARLDVRIELPGPVDHATLARHYGEADVVVALRDPCLEAASASVLEAMMLGVPTVVRSAGACADIPDDCVVKVDIGASEQPLTEALERLLGDVDLRAEIGRRASGYSRSVHRADLYASQLVETLGDMLEVAPMFGVVDEATAQLSAWGSTSTDGVERQLWDPMYRLWESVAAATGVDRDEAAE